MDRKLAVLLLLVLLLQVIDQGEALWGRKWRKWNQNIIQLRDAILKGMEEDEIIANIERESSMSK
uniref:Uncharacterized protein n=1 Tax=Ciona savignyi TaxID=51511 RepID=H2ZAH7_CIOSA